MRFTIPYDHEFEMSMYYKLSLRLHSRDVAAADFYLRENGLDHVSDEIIHTYNLNEVRDFMKDCMDYNYSEEEAKNEVLNRVSDAAIYTDELTMSHDEFLSKYDPDYRKYFGDKSNEHKESGTYESVILENAYHMMSRDGFIKKYDGTSPVSYSWENFDNNGDIHRHTIHKDRDAALSYLREQDVGNIYENNQLIEPDMNKSVQNAVRENNPIVSIKGISNNSWEKVNGEESSFHVRVSVPKDVSESGYVFLKCDDSNMIHNQNSIDLVFYGDFEKRVSCLRDGHMETKCMKLSDLAQAHERQVTEFKKSINSVSLRPDATENQSHSVKYDLIGMDL